MTDGKIVAADSQATANSEVQPGGYTKIVRDESIVFCFSGTFSLFAPLMKWYRGGRKDKDALKIEVDYPNHLWIFDPREAGPMQIINAHKCPYPEPLTVPNAMGSGGCYALGALYAGATPAEAVEIAKKLDVFSGGDIQFVDIPQKPIRTKRGRTKNVVSTN